MENRQPTYPGRVLITPESGEAYYATVTRADEPTVEGTPLNKENLLQDETCDILGIPKTSVPNDAFVKLGFGIGKYGYSIHVQLEDGFPVSGAEISGGLSPSGEPAVTDENGNAIIVSDSQSITISIESPYIDVTSISSVEIQSTSTLTKSVQTLPFIDTPLQIEESNTYTLSPSVSTYDLCSIGGGGGGGGQYQYSSGGYGSYSSSGGGGGYVNNVLGITPSANRSLTVLIGAGGTGGGIGSPSSTSDLGGTGGTTSVSDDSGAILCQAEGGEGGVSVREYITGEIRTIYGGNGNGNGGNVQTEADQTFNGKNGTSGSVYLFNDQSLGIPGGGGGGGGGNGNSATYGQGGAPYGGVGSRANRSLPATTPGNGSGPGGGGGGASQRPSWGGVNGGNGSNGAVFLRTHYVND